MLLLTVPSYAQGDISYLVVDKAKTPWGHKFYKTFIELWKPPEGIEGYFIIVEERKPSVRQSWLYVRVGDNIYMRTVYATLLKPTTGTLDMQRNALTAVKKVMRFLLKDFPRLKMEEEEL